MDLGINFGNADTCLNTWQLLAYYYTILFNSAGLPKFWFLVPKGDMPRASDILKNFGRLAAGKENSIFISKM